MQSVSQRLQEMSYSMLVRVANKYKLSVKISDDKEKIINKLTSIIHDSLAEKKSEDICINATLAKFNLVSNFEVPHEIDSSVRESQFNFKEYNTITVIDAIVIDNQWCYLYWDLSHHDYEKILNNKVFQSLEVHVLYKKNGFKENFSEYDEKDILRVSLQDKDINFYQQAHNTYCCCLLVSKSNAGGVLLAASREFYLPYAQPVWERVSELDDTESAVLQLSYGDEYIPSRSRLLFHEDIIQN